MIIEELIITNFKGFEGTHILKFEKNLIFFVGNNNTGKSTVFEAIDFLIKGLGKRKISDIKNKNADELAHVEVIAKLKGNVKNIIEEFSEKKYISYVFEDAGEEALIVKRSSEEKEIQQAKKTVKIDIKKITLWNKEASVFENPTGKDSFFNILEIQPVWADTNPDDITDFGSTKICGQLLNGAVGDFFQSPQWGEFSKIHDQTFHTGENCLKNRAKKLEEEIRDIIADQYGEVGIGFNFDLPDTASFIKAGNINIDDGNDTSSKQKGTGLQRALALALIQAYANRITKHPQDASKTKPLFLFIDEPETFLHPMAQKKLLDALCIISETQQVFVSTHSPYLLHSFDKEKHALYTFSKKGKSNNTESSCTLSLFGKSSPTWGEINYFAYNLLTVEFHNELYGFVQAKAINEDLKYGSNCEFDKYLENRGSASKIDWIHEKATGDIRYKTTLQTYIRNTIHHPENKKNPNYSNEQLKESVEKLIEILNT